MRTGFPNCSSAARPTPTTRWLQELDHDNRFLCNGCRRLMNRLPSWVTGLAGAAALLAIWAVLAVTVFSSAGSGVPTPWAVVAGLGDDGWSFYWPLIAATLGEALRGYLV